MANVLRVVGAIGTLIGLVLIAMALAPLVQGEPIAASGSFLVTQGVVAIAGGVIALGIGELIAVNELLADNMEDILEYLRSEEAGAPAGGSTRDVFANVPDYRPRRDPPVVKQGTYRDHTILTLQDGTVVVETLSGWKRFRTIRDFDRLLMV